jgi:hypothetical protein
MALRTNRDVEGWHDPHTRQWAPEKAKTKDNITKLSHSKN